MEQLYLIATAEEGCYSDFYTTVLSTKENAVATVEYMAKMDEYDCSFEEGVVDVTLVGNSLNIKFMTYGTDLLRPDPATDFDMITWSLVPVRQLTEGAIK